MPLTANVARMGGATLLVGAVLVAVWFAWALASSRGDANIGAGLVGAIGLLMALLGAALLAVAGGLALWERLPRHRRARRP